MDAPPKMLFISILNQSFVRQDMKGLGEHYRLVTFSYGWQKGLSNLRRQVELFFWLLRKGWGTKYVFIWFSDYHAFQPLLFARLFGVRSFMVIGGFDAAKIPELNYGAHVSSLRSAVVRLNCKLAGRLLPVSQVTLNSLELHTGLDLKQKSEVVYNAVDPTVFPSVDPAGRNGVICVSHATDERTVMVKGLDRLTDVARALPEVPFKIIGATGKGKEVLDAKAPGNLEVIEWTERDQLLSHYSSARVVCQLSRSESFGLAMAEGMYSGCIPVGVAGTGLAELIDTDFGFVIDEYTTEAAAAAIRSALKLGPRESQLNKKRIEDHFIIQNRINKLCDIIDSGE